MKELLNTLLTHKIDLKYRGLVFGALTLLLVFHTFVLFVPFIPEEIWPYLTEARIDAFQAASDSLANITIGLILILITFEGQNSLRLYIIRSRQGTYKAIREEILNWLRATRPQAFDATDPKARFIYGDKPDEIEVLQHLKVSGSPGHLMALYQYPETLHDWVEKYSTAIHFEFTRYPAEVLYGIHYELDDYSVSQQLATALTERLNLAKQSSDLVVDTHTPKQPDWIFMTRTIELSGDIDKDYAVVMTHARHFVELVCHCYDYLYSREMIDLFLRLHHQLD